MDLLGDHLNIVFKYLIKIYLVFNDAVQLVAGVAAAALRGAGVEDLYRSALCINALLIVHGVLGA